MVCLIKSIAFRNMDHNVSALQIYYKFIFKKVLKVMMEKEIYNSKDIAKEIGVTQNRVERTLRAVFYTYNPVDLREMKLLFPELLKYTEEEYDKHLNKEMVSAFNIRLNHITKKSLRTLLNFLLAVKGHRTEDIQYYVDKTGTNPTSIITMCKKTFDVKFLHFINVVTDELLEYFIQQTKDKIDNKIDEEINRKAETVFKSIKPEIFELIKNGLSEEQISNILKNYLQNSIDKFIKI